MLLNSAANSHHQIEVILTYVLLGIILIKIAIRIFFSTLHTKTNDPFVTKSNKTLIDYKELSNSYFQYFSIKTPNINKTLFQTKKFKHYNIKNQELANLSIPKIIDNTNLNGFNLDYILAHNWLYKYHLKHRFIAPIQKFLVYYAYDICSIIFYIFVLIRIAILIIFSKSNALQNNPVFKQINETHILTIISFSIFFLSLLFIAYGIWIKHQWEKQYEKESIDFVKQNFNEYLADYQLARSFSKKHKFAIYFRPRNRSRYNQQMTVQSTIQNDKYLGPFVIIKNSRYSRRAR